LSDCPHKKPGSITLTPTVPPSALPTIPPAKVVPPIFSARAIPPTGPTQSMQRNPGLNNKGMALPSQQPTQKGARPRVVRGKGQAYNLTAEEAEASDEVVAGNILVYSIPVLSLFNSGASHCFLSNTFTALHAIP